MHTRQLTRRRRTRPRRGFTLVELMVAVLILTVGVLGLASTSLVVGRLINGSGQRTVAANVAASRFERMRSVRCVTAPSAGTATTRGIREHWGVVNVVDAVTYLVVDTVWFTDSRGNTSRQTFRTDIRTTC